MKNIIERIGDLPNWSEYEPQVQHYSNYSSNVVTAASKIADVNRTYCTGRASFVYYESNDFGHLVRSGDEISLKYFKSILLYNSLSSYNICIDLSWQVVWLFLSDLSLDLIYDEKKYNNYLNECNMETLNYKLTLAKEIKLKNHVNDFFNSAPTQKIRKKYNYYKHKGAFYVPGLGENLENLPFSFNELTLKQMKREEFDLEEWCNILIDYQNYFYEYFEYIINFVIPKTYLEQESDLFRDTIIYGLKVEEYFKISKLN